MLMVKVQSQDVGLADDGVDDLVPDQTIRGHLHCMHPGCGNNQ